MSLKDFLTKNPLGVASILFASIAIMLQVKSTRKILRQFGIRKRG